MSVPVVAIVGRPNVGKSTLFNRLIGERKAIIDDIPGVTRDRNYGSCTWQGNNFLLIDTGGLDTGTDEELYAMVHQQALIAVKEADLIIFLMDAKDGILPADEEIYLMLKKGNKPLVCAVNKVDNSKVANTLSDFYSLGIDSFFPISTAHGIGVDALMSHVLGLVVQSTSPERHEQRDRLAIIGKPNVGKSSLLNKILRQERSLVSDIPGTTRDCIDTPFTYNHRSYLIIDTAGIRKRTKVKRGLERLSVIKTLKNIDECQVALFLIDAVQGVNEQDERIAGFAHEAGRATVIVVNKWDLVVKDEKSMKNFEEEVRYRLKYLHYAPIIFISAKTGQRVYKIFPIVEKVMDQYRKRITTGQLNRTVEEIISQLSPPLHRGKRIKFSYQTQVSVEPPTFAFFVNLPQGIHFSYKRYLQNQLRERLGLDSVPIHLIFRAKGKA